MAWLFILLLALLLFGLLWRFARFDKAGLQLVAAALFLALAGYAWQGRPDLPGKSASGEAEQARAGGEAFAALRRQILGQFDAAGSWLTIADSYLARGDSLSAVEILRSGIRAHPRDADLWVGLGNALFLHAEGRLTAAADLAFARAQQLAPGNPAPKFFHGLALAQAGRFAEAEAAWQEVVAKTPPGTSWRPLVEERLQLLIQIRAIAEGRAPMPQAPSR